jgi:hypothetical protein
MFHDLEAVVVVIGSMITDSILGPPLDVTE